MIWLAIDGALGAFSAALVASDDAFAQRTAHASGNDALERGLSVVDEVLGDRSLADVGAIAVGLGPGGFTGLRIALSYAKGLAFAANIPLAGVSSYDALGPQNAHDAAQTHVTFVHGRTGIACARLRIATAEGRAAGIGLPESSPSIAGPAATASGGAEPSAEESSRAESRPLNPAPPSGSSGARAYVACGTYADIAAELAAMVPPGMLVATYGNAEGAASALGELVTTVPTARTSAVTPALAVARYAIASGITGSPHALRADYGEAHYAERRAAAEFQT